MADIINVPTYEQIATILSKLATNYSNLSSVFYDVFYNTVPADVTFKMYDEAGTLQEYTIPNRAKDKANMLNGKGSPEDTIAATMGVIYQDLENGKLYVKETSSGNTGWSEVTTGSYLSTFFIKGNGSPEGQIVAKRGVLYVDEQTASLYIKESETGDTGWVQASISGVGFAYTDLSNVNIFGENRIKEIANENAKTFISEDSTDAEYPSSKCVYNAVAGLRSDVSTLSNGIDTLESTKQDKSNLVQTLTSASTESTYPSAKCMYDLVGNLEDIINAL
jgi:hypothetical protein